MSRIFASEGTLNARHITPDEIKVNDRFGYKVVVVVQPGEGPVAYYGHTNQSDEEIARWGDQLPLEVIRIMFPTIYLAYFTIVKEEDTGETVVTLKEQP